MAWWSDLVGRPFGPDFECWSLVRLVYRERLGIDLPAHGDVSASYVAAVEMLRNGRGNPVQAAAARAAVVEAFESGRSADSWQTVAAPQQFDVVMMGGPHAQNKRVMHVGVAVDHRRVLHVEKATGTVLVPLSHPSVAGRIIGFKRHRTQCA